MSEWVSEEGGEKGVNEVSTSLFCTYILALFLMVHSAQSKMGTTSIKNHFF